MNTTFYYNRSLLNGSIAVFVGEERDNNYYNIYRPQITINNNNKIILISCILIYIDNRRSIAPCSPRQASPTIDCWHADPCDLRTETRPPPSATSTLQTATAHFYSSTDTFTTILPPLPYTCTTYIRPPPQTTRTDGAPFFRSL